MPRTNRIKTKDKSQKSHRHKVKLTPSGLSTSSNPHNEEIKRLQHPGTSLRLTTKNKPEKNCPRVASTWSCQQSMGRRPTICFHCALSDAGEVLRHKSPSAESTIRASGYSCRVRLDAKRRPYSLRLRSHNPWCARAMARQVLLKSYWRLWKVSILSPRSWAVASCRAIRQPKYPRMLKLLRSEESCRKAISNLILIATSHRQRRHRRKYKLSSLNSSKMERLTAKSSAKDSGCRGSLQNQTQRSTLKHNRQRSRPTSKSQQALRA